jgi:hypothetical protein
MMLSEGALHGEIPMTVLPKKESPEERRRRLIEEAEEHRRKHPVPPVKEVLAEAKRIRESLPKDLNLPDSTELLRESRGSLDELPRREAITCTPEELVAASWNWEADETTDPDELRRRLIQEAEEYRRRHPTPPQKEVLERIRRRRTFRPADVGAPDSTTLLREDRER